MKSISIIDTKDVAGKEAELYGWVDAIRSQKHLVFMDLRDRSGIVQIVFSDEITELFQKAQNIKLESVIRVKGKVIKREGGVNENIPTGEIEIKPLELEILNEAKDLPFEIKKDTSVVSEDVRLKYRYLDLRSARLQKNLIARHKVIQFFREYLSRDGFIEIETPMLTKSTPEGARDYVVPSRLHPGKFYALPQSPQQYKQLLMVAGMEKYFQLARAIRDEDTRGDRQPEHTQLDIEMSFTSPEEVMELVESMTVEMMKKLFPGKKVKTPWPKISYDDSMQKYGTDKPDLRENKDDPDEVAFGWVVDFPQFELDKATKALQPVHHMFVQPRADSVDFIDSDPLKMISTQYDWVCNGYELASGSMRITDVGLQMKVFKLLGMSEEKAKNEFGHLLEAFSFGVPPHGGIAPGIDRLLMILMGEPNIREVIAFPKTGDGRDLMMNAPSELSPEQLKELRIKIEEK